MFPFINLHTHHKETNNNIVSIFNQDLNNFKNVLYYSIGIHPWFINSEQINTDLKQIETHIKSSQCLAIGECGLDKVCDTNFELQQEVFNKQIQLAKNTAKPMIIHCVKAFDKLIALKKQHPDIIMIIHGFNKNNILGKQLQKHGFYLSYGRHILSNNNLLEGINMQLLFLETDTSDINIQTIYTSAAKQLNVSLPALKKELVTNFKAVFKS